MGSLVWEGKKHNGKEEMACSVFTTSPVDEKVLTKIQWPPKLTMQLIPQSIVDSAFEYRRYSRLVRFSPDEMNLSFTKLLAELFSGSVGLVDLTHPQTPFNKRGLLLNRNSNNMLFGSVPNNQQYFMASMQRIIKSIPQPKSMVDFGKQVHKPVDPVKGVNNNQTYVKSNNLNNSNIKPNSAKVPSPKISSNQPKQNEDGNHLKKNSRWDQPLHQERAQGPTTQSNIKRGQVVSSYVNMTSEQILRNQLENNIQMVVKQPDQQVPWNQTPHPQNVQQTPVPPVGGPQVNKCQPPQLTQNNSHSPGLQSQTKYLEQSQHSPREIHPPVVQSQSKNGQQPQHTQKGPYQPDQHWVNNPNQPPYQTQQVLGQPNKQPNWDKQQIIQRTNQNLKRSLSPCKSEPSESGPPRKRCADKSSTITTFCDSTNTFSNNHQLPTTSRGNLNSNPSLHNNAEHVSGTHNSAANHKYVNKSKNIEDLSNTNKEQLINVESSPSKSEYYNSSCSSPTSMQPSNLVEIKSEVVGNSDNVKFPLNISKGKNTQRKKKKTSIKSKIVEDSAVSTTQINSQEWSVNSSAVLDQLMCNACHQLMNPEEVFYCHCQLVCLPCNEKNLQACDECLTPFLRNLGLSNFYKRVLAATNHPCINQVFGCVYMVQPGDFHEYSCTFKPVDCMICNQKITKILLHSHFELEHPGQSLKCKNNNVEIGSFWKNPVTGDHQIYCFPNIGGPLLITLSKSTPDIDTVHFIFTVEGDNDEVDLRTKINFNFNLLQMYKNQLVVKLDNNQKGIIRVQKEYVTHWFEKVSTLDIIISRKQVKAKAVKKANKKISI